MAKIPAWMDYCADSKWTLRGTTGSGLILARVIAQGFWEVPSL
jgi:hypothetical protein